MVTVTRVGPALTELSPGVLHVMSGSLLLICLSAVHCASVCQWGRYGQHCELYCSEHCRRHPIRNPPPCHKDTGKCLEGCVRGRHGDLCDQLCSHNCINTTCNQPNGRCTLGCTYGYTGYFCNISTVCQWGKYGQHCELNCSEHCRRHPIRNLAPCDKDTGKCLEGCVRGRHGDLCDQLCSHNCINTTCIQPNGRCTLGCTDGYTGYFCNITTAQSGTLCDSGQYGPNCDLHCSDHCGLLPETNHRPCHKNTGKCLKGCVRGRHGDLCDQLCSHNCIDTTCNQPDGGCTLGCTDGYTGNICKNTDTGKGHTTYSGHVMWMLPVIVFFFTTICCWRSGRCRRTCNRGCDWLTERILWSPWTGRNQGRRGPGPLPQVTRGETITHDSRDPSQGGSETEPLLQVTNPTSSTHATPSQADHDLYYACRAGDLEEVKRILAAGHADINSRGRRSRTPVMTAAWRGHSDVVELLVSRGADLSLVTDDGNNILHWACRGGDRKTVEFVLSLDGLDVNSRGLGSWTPVMAAAMRGHSDVVELLVGRGADLTLVSDEGDNILHFACKGGDRKTVEFVLSLDVVDVNSRGRRSRTPVMEAAGRGHSDVVELLVSRGADLSLVNDDGDNILHWACWGRDRKTVEFVLSLDGVDVNARNNDGQTAADVARHCGHRQLSDLLVSRGTQ